MCTSNFIGMMFTVDLYGNRGFDSRRIHGTRYSHRMLYYDVYYNCHNLTDSSKPSCQKALGVNIWTIDCFLQVTGHWHQV